jgi:hypothetical protein
MAALGITASPASAGTYSVTTCAPADPANGAWVAFNSNPGELQTQVDCGQGVLGDQLTSATDGLSATDDLSATGDAPANATSGWTFTAPAGTTVSGFAISYDLFKDSDNNWHFFVRDQSQPVTYPGLDCTINPNVAYQCDASGTLTQASLSDTSLSVGLYCGAIAPVTCGVGALAHQVRADIDSSQVTISDPIAPSGVSAQAPSGYQHATASVNVDASDTAAGIAQLQVRSGSTVVGTYTPTCDYTKLTPCPAQLTAQPVTVDTTQLPDGSAPLTVVATDAAGNSTSTSTSLLVDNNAPAAPTLTGVPAAWTRSSSFQATAALPADPVPVATLDWSLCDALATSCGPPTQVPVPAGADAVPFTITAATDGIYAVHVWLVDVAGRQDQLNSAASVPFFLDASTPPAAPKSLRASLSPSPAGGASASLAWSEAPALAPVTAVEWQLCGPADVPCTTPRELVDTGRLDGMQLAKPGTYVARVWLLDAAGNSGPAATVSITVPPASPTTGHDPGSAPGPTVLALARHTTASGTFSPITRAGTTLTLRARFRTRADLRLSLTAAPARRRATLTVRISISGAGRPTGDSTRRVILTDGRGAIDLRIGSRVRRVAFHLSGLDATGTRIVLVKP